MKYTRKQIREAIDYWRSLLNENLGDEEETPFDPLPAPGDYELDESEPVDEAEPIIGPDGRRIPRAALKDFLRRKLSTDPVWAKKALLRIFDNQTEGEQWRGDVRARNYIGFTVQDAKILTSFANFYRQRSYLTDRQTNWLMELMGKYAGQLMAQSYFDMNKLAAAYVRSLGDQTLPLG